MPDEPPPRTVADISVATDAEEAYFELREEMERNVQSGKAKLSESRVQPVGDAGSSADFDQSMWDAADPKSIGKPTFHDHLTGGHKRPAHNVRRG